jgi:hypothetical protein
MEDVRKWEVRFGIVDAIEVEGELYAAQLRQEIPPIWVIYRDGNTADAMGRVEARWLYSDDLNDFVLKVYDTEEVPVGTTHSYYTALSWLIERKERSDG